MCQTAAQRGRTAVLSHLGQAGLCLPAVDTGTSVTPEATTVPRFGNPAAAIRPLLLILILAIIVIAIITIIIIVVRHGTIAIKKDSERGLRVIVDIVDMHDIVIGIG